jgi:hypothetical protein
MEALVLEAGSMAEIALHLQWSLQVLKGGSMAEVQV